MSGQKTPMSWGMIISIMVGVGFVSGLLIGAISMVVSLSPTFTTSGVGAAIGVSGALLMTRRAAQLEVQEEQDKEG